MKQWLGALTIAGALAACSSTPTAEQDSATGQQRTPRASSTTTTPKTATAQPGSAVTAANAGVDASGVLSKRSVYFEYDSNIVKDEYKPIVSAHAGNLAQHRGTRVTIQGNTDERGSREYNLALGQRRAEALKQRMTLLGAPAAQIETVSFGEEKPRAEDSSERAHAENRRADIVYRNE